MAMPECVGRAHVPPSALVEPMPRSLLDEPLEYIFADHFRHRRVCATLKRCAADGEATLLEADAVGRFLRRDLVWHHGDEDEDLFPALRRRSLPQDDLIAALDRLEADHRRSEPLAEAIVASLAGATDATGIRLTSGARRTMDAYAADEQRHLAIENGIVLAIARIRLTRGDLQRMSEAMKRRRGALA